MEVAFIEIPEHVKTPEQLQDFISKKEGAKQIFPSVYIAEGDGSVIPVIDKNSKILEKIEA